MICRHLLLDLALLLLCLSAETADDKSQVQVEIATLKMINMSASWDGSVKSYQQILNKTKHEIAIIFSSDISTVILSQTA